MKLVNIQYHLVADATADIPFLVNELTSLYETSEIDLDLSEGESIDLDPTYSARCYPYYVEHFSQMDHKYGHLIIGSTDRQQRIDVNGELLDPDHRGVAVAYTHSIEVKKKGQNALLNVCAHEIGHMLNLGHEDVSPLFASVMNNQSQKRQQKVDQCWDAAKKEAQTHVDSNESSYFDPPQNSLPCYPFAWEARRRINTYTDDELLPWRSQFKHRNEVAEDKWFDKSLHIKLESKRYIVGGALAFSIRFQNNGTRPRSIPAQIGTEFDTLLLSVTRPDGKRYRHRSRTLACSRRRRVLKPGEEIIRPFCTVRGPGGAVFSKPGRYLVSVVFPQGRAAAEPIEINVEPRGDGPLANPRFQRFIAKGASHRSPLFLRRLDEALGKDAHLEPTSRGYLALIRAHTERDPPRAAALHKIALDDKSPTAVRHAAVIAQVKALVRNGALNKAAWLRVKESHLKREEDQYLIEQLEEFQS